MTTSQCEPITAALLELELTPEIRHKIQDVLTLDQRHFRLLAANDEPFRLLPADN